MRTPQTVLQVQEVPGYSRTHPGQSEDKALHIDYHGRHFALLYVTPQTYTVAWEGIVDFKHLESEITDALKVIGQEDASYGPPTWHKASVAFVFPRSDDDDELVKYRLSIPEEFTQYSKTLQDPGAISFARYDFYDPDISFIVENAALPQNWVSSEVALKLPRHYMWTEALLGWVIRHHKDGHLLTQAVAWEPSVAVLNQQLGITGGAATAIP